jgi:hypothetical protein
MSKNLKILKKILNIQIFLNFLFFIAVSYLLLKSKIASFFVGFYLEEKHFSLKSSASKENKIPVFASLE